MPPRRRESPVRRRYASGEVVWIARYTGRDGRRRIAKPTWNRGFGTFSTRREAQRAIDEAYGISDVPETLGEYMATWLERHPRAERTNATYRHRIGRVAEVEIEGLQLSAWPLAALRRRHALALVDHMLRVQGRATTGAVGILRALSALAEDAITDEVIGGNPFKGLRVRANDPRARKRRRPVRVFGFPEMHRFARAAGPHEALVRVFTDTGLRLGEVLALHCDDFDGASLAVRRTAHEGEIQDGTKTDHGEPNAGRIVPVPSTLASMLALRISALSSHGGLLFGSPRGKVWRERNFYGRVWTPAREAAGIDIRPHECRHSYLTHLRRANVDDADLARIAGHSVSTLLAHYAHPASDGFAQVRAAIG